MVTKTSFEVIEFGKLVGVDSLWDIAFGSDHEKIRNESSEMLMNLHLKLDRNIQVEEKR
jgi:hypothetical protein